MWIPLGTNFQQRQISMIKFTTISTAPDGWKNDIQKHNFKSIIRLMIFRAAAIPALLWFIWSCGWSTIDSSKHWKKTTKVFKWKHKKLIGNTGNPMLATSPEPLLPTSITQILVCRPHNLISGSWNKDPPWVRIAKRTEKIIRGHSQSPWKIVTRSPFKGISGLWPLQSGGEAFRKLFKFPRLECAEPMHNQQSTWFTATHSRTSASTICALPVAETVHPAWSSSVTSQPTELELMQIILHSKRQLKKCVCVCVWSLGYQKQSQLCIWKM